MCHRCDKNNTPYTDTSALLTQFLRTLTSSERGRSTSEIYPLSLHDALPIWVLDVLFDEDACRSRKDHAPENLAVIRDRKSTRLNSSHPSKSYAVFCLKKKTTRASLPADASFGCPPRQPDHAQARAESLAPDL